MAEKKINGQLYKVLPLTARDALALYADIMRIAGKAVNRLPAIIIALSSDDEGQNAMADVAALAAITDILRDTPTSDVIEVVERILAVAQVVQPSGTMRTVDLDGDFTGKLKDMIPVLRFVISEQYADFFTASAGNGILGMLKDSLRPTK